MLLDLKEDGDEYAARVVQAVRRCGEPGRTIVGVEMIRLWPKWLADSALVDRVRRAGVQLHLNGTTGDAAELSSLLRHRPDSVSGDDPARIVATLRELRAAEK